jgi:hypothetical protein
MMKEMRAIMSTTHVDLHGDRFMLAALESAVDLFKRSYLPVGVEHDPRIPPLGRVVRASIHELADGEYALEGEMEIFEPGRDVFPAPSEGRSIPIHLYPPGVLQVASDRGLRAAEDQEIIREISALLGTEPEEEFKKSVDPITILMLGGAFVLGGIANAFLKRLGDDAYEQLKRKLTLLFHRQRPAAETLLRLNLIVRCGDEDVEVDLLASGPDRRALDVMLGSGLKSLDELLPSLSPIDHGIKRLVFEYKEGGLRLQFGVRRDAVPVFPARENEEGMKSGLPLQQPPSSPEAQ